MPHHDSAPLAQTESATFTSRNRRLFQHNRPGPDAAKFVLAGHLAHKRRQTRDRSRLKPTNVMLRTECQSRPRQLLAQREEIRPRIAGEKIETLAQIVDGEL